jgi:ArsR family transcriptional regulator
VYRQSNNFRSGVKFGKLGLYQLDDSVDSLLDILGNETRRRILQLLADEPRYFIQLSKDLGVSQQAVLKHLELLEKSGFIASYEGRSEFAAPKRKYYQLSKSLRFAFGITKDTVGFEFQEIPADVLDGQIEAQDKEIARLSSRAKSLAKENNPSEVIKGAGKLLSEIDEKINDIGKKEIALLRIKQQVSRKAHEVIRGSFSEGLHRKILYSALENSKLNIDELSEKFDVREKEIATAIKALEKRLSLQ